jgi:hypothetical protein
MAVVVPGLTVSVHWWTQAALLPAAAAGLAWREGTIAARAAAQSTSSLVRAPRIAASSSSSSRR